MRLVRSFRARIFVVTALIVAAVVGLFAALGWARLMSSEAQRLNDRLCNEARRLSNVPPPAREMDRFAEDVALKLQLSDVSGLLLSFNGPGDPRAARTARWPEGLDLDALPWALVAEGGPPPGPPPGGRPGESAGQDPPRMGPGRPPPRCSLAGFTQGRTEWRAALVATPRGRGFVAADTVAAQAELRGDVRRAVAIAAPMALLLTAAGAWLLSSLALRPVVRLRDSMKAMDPRALDQRLPAGREDREFDDLIRAYNAMLARLEASFHQASRFSADAAHELKTPLTILQGQIERAIAGADGRAIQADLTAMLDEVVRLASITRKLLLLSQADAGQLAVLRRPVDLSRLVQDCVADAQMLEGPSPRLSMAVPDGLRVQADEQLLSQVLHNLASNAFKYTPTGGWITIAARALGAGVEVVFSNSSAPLSTTQRQHFFERFFRGDVAHTRRVDGHGLGLSLAREIARAHGGELSLEPSPPEQVVLRLTLP